jgi:hypothetical protein
MYNVLKQILEFICLTSETISIVDWDIRVFRSLTPHKLYAYNGLGSRLYCRRRTAATSENPKLFPGIMIGNHRLIRKQILDGGCLRYHHGPRPIPTRGSIHERAAAWFDAPMGTTRERAFGLNPQGAVRRDQATPKTSLALHLKEDMLQSRQEHNRSLAVAGSGVGWDMKEISNLIELWKSFEAIFQLMWSWHLQGEGQPSTPVLFEIWPVESAAQESTVISVTVQPNQEVPRRIRFLDAACPFHFDFLCPVK